MLERSTDGSSYADEISFAFFTRGGRARKSNSGSSDGSPGLRHLSFWRFFRSFQLGFAKAGCVRQVYGQLAFVRLCIDRHYTRMVVDCKPSLASS